MGLRKLDYWCCLVIHIIPLPWLFIQIQTQMDFPAPCQIHQLSYVVLCINNFLSSQCTYFSIGFFFTSKVQRGNETCQFICCFFDSQILTFVIHGKIDTTISNLGHPSVVSYVWGFISPHLRAQHNNMPYIRHYIPQVMVSVEEPN